MFFIIIEKIEEILVLVEQLFQSVHQTCEILECALNWLRLGEIYSCLFEVFCWVL